MDVTTIPGPDPYHEIGPLYDLEHASFRADVDLLVTIAQAVGDPILELGCGSGRILVPLAEAGFRVTGLDASRPMLDRAREAIRSAGVADRVTLVEGDMRSADRAPGGPFGLVIFSLNSLMHLTTPQDQRAALEAAYRSLDPRGQLVIDTMNPSPDQLSHLQNGPHLEGSWTLPDGTSVDKWSHRRVSPATQIIETVLWYDRVEPGGSLKRVRSAFALRYVHASELALMLELSGFTEPMIYGSYELDPYTDESDRILVTAEVTPSSGADVPIAADRRHGVG